MRIKCGPRRIRKLRITKCVGPLSPRVPARLPAKLGTLMTWPVFGSHVAHRLCDEFGDMAKLGGIDRWPKIFANYYIAWYSKLPQNLISAILPVFLYEFQSIQCLSTTPFDNSNSRQIGWIYCSRDLIRAMCPHYVSSGVSVHEERIIVEEVLRKEIAEMDHYLHGEVYDWSVEDIWNTPGSRSGIIQASMNGYYGMNPLENGMIEDIPHIYHPLLQETMHELGYGYP